MSDYPITPDWDDIRRMADATAKMSQQMDEHIAALIPPLANAIKLMCAYIEVHEEAIRRLVHSMQTGRLVTLDEMKRAQRLREMLDELPDPIKTTMANVGRSIGIVPMTMEEILAADPGPEDKPPAGADETLPGPYRVCPDDGNSYRMESENDGRYPARVVLTDCFGSHEMTVTKAEWETWPIDITPEHIINRGEEHGNP